MSKCLPRAEVLVPRGVVTEDTKLLLPILLLWIFLSQPLSGMEGSYAIVAECFECLAKEKHFIFVWAGVGVGAGQSFFLGRVLTNQTELTLKLK